MPPRLPADSKSSVASDGDRIRLYLERVVGAQLMGWAADLDAPGTEVLAVRWGLASVPAQVRRVHRADVCDALGLPRALALGFELELGLAAWAIMREPGRLHITVNGHASEHAQLLPTAEGMRERVRQLGQTKRVGQLENARLHLAEAERADLPAAPDAAPLLAAMCEGLRGITLHGWVLDSAAQPAAFAVQVGDVVLPLHAHRMPRADVAHEYGRAADEALGFEADIPGCIWSAERVLNAAMPAAPQGGMGNVAKPQGFMGAESLRVQLLVAGRACGPARRLDRARLLAADTVPTDASPARRHEHALMLWEHLLHTRQWGSAPARLREGIAAAARRAGLAARLTDDAVPEMSQRAEPSFDRAPTLARPRGRLGRWLERPGRAAWALQTLQALRRQRWLDPLTHRVETALTRACGWFDATLYLAQWRAFGGPADAGPRAALAHYVQHGDALGLVPMVLFDPRHYTAQLDGRRHPGVNRLLHYALWGRHQRLTPSAWFDPEAYRSANADLGQLRRADLLRHWLNHGWKEGRRPYPGFVAATQVLPPLVQRLAGDTAAPAADARLATLLAGSHDVDMAPSAQPMLPWAARPTLGGQDYLAPQRWQALPARPAASAGALTVVVPVYAGAQESLRCLWQLLSSPTALPHRVLVVDDCSPEPALSQRLALLAQAGHIELLVNEANRGFVASVNRALAHCGDGDVVLLNADTAVYPGWLDRLAAHAQAEPRAASVTPLSNNATIASYPDMPDGGPPPDDGAAIDAAAARVNAGVHVSAPTGVGFCLWMRRSVIDAIGTFDEAAFGLGYGEENDWCQRAAAAGWVNLIAADVYVLHEGAVSFAGQSSARSSAAQAVLQQRYPDYADAVRRWIAEDPLAQARARLDAGSLCADPALPLDAPVVLLVTHARGGGTERVVQEECARLTGEAGARAVVLRPSATAQCVSLSTPSAAAPLNLAALPLAGAASVWAMLQAVGVKSVQLHQLVDLPPEFAEQLIDWCTRQNVPYSVFVHDYYHVCPRLNLVGLDERYCNEPVARHCDNCIAQGGPLEAAPHLPKGRVKIVPWRERNQSLLEHAELVRVPSVDTAERLQRHFGNLRLRVQPHQPTPPLPSQDAPAGPPRKVLVVGAISEIKGFRAVWRLAQSPVARDAGMQVTLLGHSIDDGHLRRSGVEVLGRYDDADLAARIAALAPDVIFIPSLWPETYCYVLTAAMAASVRIATFDLGAQAQRLRDWDPQQRWHRRWSIGYAADGDDLAGKFLAW